MQKKLFRPLGTLLCAGLLLGALTIPAMAAGDITVRVDDRAVQFTDARPLIRNDRTYVPFRAIFEQMGAAVRWNENTQTVTATRDGRDVRFQIGKTGVAITENGSTQTVDTDALPFVEGGRTYVPVRFASQSLGACVDWVQDTRSVLIVDVAKLMDGYAAAFTKVDRYLAFAGAGETRAVSGSFTLDLTYASAMGQLPVRMTGAVAGSENAGATQLSGTVKTDVRALRAAVEKNEGAEVVDTEIQALLTHLESTTGQAVLSRADGKLYLSGPLLTELGVQADGWAAIPYSSIGGKSLADLRTAAGYGSFARYAAAAAQQLTLKTAPSQTVSTVRTYLDGLQTAYGDSAFQAEGADNVLKNPAGTEVLRLREGVSGAIENARLTGVYAEGMRNYRAVIEQTAGGCKLSLTGRGEQVSDFVFTLTLSAGQGGASPMLRPAGDVAEVHLP